MFIFEHIKHHTSTVDLLTRGMWLGGMKGNEKMVMAAVQQDGGSLLYASAGMKGNEKVVMAAVQKGDCNIRYASDDMKSNEKVNRMVATSFSFRRA